MILAVAGMSEDEMNRKTQRLAHDDSGLPAGERAALALARKQAKLPSSVTGADLEKLEKLLGPEKAWQAAWWAARCHYMTRVADAFQFPLERDNPFRVMPGAREKK